MTISFDYNGQQQAEQGNVNFTMPGGDQQQQAETGPSPEQEKKAKAFAQGFSEYVKSEQFKSDCEEAAQKSGLPPKRVAQTFFAKAIGTLGDILGIGLTIVHNALGTAIEVIGNVGRKVLDTIHQFLMGLVQMCTLNKTACA